MYVHTYRIFGKAIRAFVAAQNRWCGKSKHCVYTHIKRGGTATAGIQYSQKFVHLGEELSDGEVQQCFPTPRVARLAGDC